jgi:hypothetical protein
MFFRHSVQLVVNPCTPACPERSESAHQEGRAAEPFGEGLAQQTIRTITLKPGSEDTLHASVLMPPVRLNAAPLAAGSQKHTAVAQHSLHACQERPGYTPGLEQGPPLVEHRGVLVPSCAWAAGEAAAADAAAVLAAEVAPARQAGLEAATAASVLHVPPAHACIWSSKVPSTFRHDADSAALIQFQYWIYNPRYCTRHSLPKPKQQHGSGRGGCKRWASVCLDASTAHSTNDGSQVAQDASG